jgi:hypothetical protein
MSGGMGHSPSDRQSRLIELEPEIAQLSCKWCVEVAMNHCCENAADDCDGELLPKDGLSDGHHQQSDREVGNYCGQETWRRRRYVCFCGLSHYLRFHHDRRRAATVGGYRSQASPAAGTSPHRLTLEVPGRRRKEAKMAITGATTQEMRRVLTAEGVFSEGGTADEYLLLMMWRIRDSDEYRERLRALQAP